MNREDVAGTETGAGQRLVCRKGLELTAEVHAAVERALDNPLAHLLLRKDPHVRRVLARRFPYRISYSFGRTLSLFSQFCMLHKTNGTG